MDEWLNLFAGRQSALLRPSVISNAKGTKSRDTRNPRRSGFTLIELLIVIVVLTILAGLLLPSLRRAREKGQALDCLNNKRQLQLAWQLYATDYNGRLVPNGWNIPMPPQPELGLWWAQGFLDYQGGNSENTNTLLLTDAKYARLGPYTQSPTLYKCPGDRSTVKLGRRSYPRARSVSMNQYTGGIAQCGTLNLRLGPQTDDQIVNPSMNFVFIDEHPDSIDFTQFLIPLADSANRDQMFSYPGSFHSRSASVSFADGHVELHRWSDQRTTPPPSYKNRLLFGVITRENADLKWLQERTFKD